MEWLRTAKTTSNNVIYVTSIELPLPFPPKNFNQIIVTQKEDNLSFEMHMKNVRNKWRICLEPCTLTSRPQGIQRLRANKQCHLSIQGPQGRYCIGLDKGEKLPIVYSPNGRFECINMTLPIRYLVYQYYQTQLGGGGYSARAYMCPVAPPFVQVAMVVDLYLRYQLLVSC